MQTTTVIPVGVTNSFVDGVVPLFVKAKMDDDAIQARCLWLQNHGFFEEAERILEAYCSRLQ